MIKIRKSDERGHFNHGWLNTHHTFSLSDYYDPKHMGFRSLRVINEDIIQAKEGFDTHSHKDMEIITYVLEGALEHKDSMGNGSVITPGEVQYMSAGTGVSHSEKNSSDNKSVHLLQIWILPEKTGFTPGYDQRNFSDLIKLGQLTLVASREGLEGSISIHQDVKLFVGRISSSKNIQYGLNPERYGWVQVSRGEIFLNDQKLSQGDGAEIMREPELNFKSDGESEFLLFDLD
jgi:redox-sensitive bicupin YhaK (pirin superfamily)